MKEERSNLKNVRTPGKRLGQTLGHLMLATALGVALTACGGDDSDDKSEDKATVEVTETVTASPDSEPTGAVEPTPTSDAEKPAELKLATVSGRDLTAVTAAGDATGTETLNGKLIIAERGCLHVTNRKGAPTLLVFPGNAKLDANRKPTMVIDGARYPVGTRLTLTGETMQLDAAQAGQIEPCVARGKVFQIAEIG